MIAIYREFVDWGENRPHDVSIFNLWVHKTKRKGGAQPAPFPSPSLLPCTRKERKIQGHLLGGVGTCQGSRREVPPSFAA